MHLVSVPIDYSENTRVLIDELREKLKTVDEPVRSEQQADAWHGAERPRTANRCESAMSDKINEQAEKMREMAQTTLDKAKDAVSKYMAESQKMREKADAGFEHPTRARKR